MAGAEEKWLGARAAVELFVSAYKNDYSAQTAIIERCANSRIASRCAVANSEYVHLKQYIDDRNGRAVLPYFWARFRDDGRRMHADWIAGDFTLFDGSVIHGNLAKDCLIRLSDVEFREADLMATHGVVPSVAVSPATVPTTHAGGRPKWDGWEDLWAEIGARLYVGDLKPTKQADIETAMLTIAEHTADGPKIAVIRTRARKLWRLIQKDEN